MILPYHINDGIPSMPDSLIRSLWDRLKEKGRPLADELDSPEAFVGAMKRFKITLLGKEGKQPEGFVYIADYNPSCIECHFQFFCVGKRADEIALEFFGWAWATFPELNTIMGYTPVNNQLACRFLERVGGERLCCLPGKYWLNGKAEDANLYIWRRGHGK